MVFTDLIFVSFIISKAKHLKLFLDINNNNINSRKECTVPLNKACGITDTQKAVPLTGMS